MSDEVVPSPASDVKPEVKNTNMSPEEFASLRLAKLTQKAPPAPKAEEPKQESGSEAEPSAKEAKEPPPDFKEGEDKPKESKEGSKDVLSKSVEDLTDEEIAELAQKGKSGLLKRIAELTAKRKLAEEKAAQMEAALRQQQPQLKEEIAENPFSKIETAEELQAKYSEVSEVIEWADDLLDKHEHASGDDVVANVNGQELSKARVKELRRHAMRAKDKYLPAQLKEVQAKAARDNAKKAYWEKARQELDWLDGEDNDVRKNFEALVKNPVLERVRKAVPEVEADLDYVLAHAANSMFGRRNIALTESKPAPKLAPPASPSSSAAAPERKETSESKQAKEAYKRLASGNGNVNDFVAFRAAEIAKRSKVKL